MNQAQFQFVCIKGNLILVDEFEDCNSIRLNVSILLNSVFLDLIIAQFNVGIVSIVSMQTWSI